MLAELLELVPSGVEEVTLPDGTVEYAVYGAIGELPAVPDLIAAAGGALVEVSSSEIADDWQDRWRSFHRPLVLGDWLTVRPPWEPASGATALDVVIDPGQAFGTGAHPTTRLCLELLWAIGLARRAQSPNLGSLLDLGCGSGVLAITAAKLGFDPVLAVDLESAAIEATRQNARANGVELARVARLDVRRDQPPTADVIVANLTGPLLGVLAERVPAEVRTLILSGLLQAEADRVAAAFSAAGRSVRERRDAGEWSALVLS